MSDVHTTLSAARDLAFRGDAVLRRRQVFGLIAAAGLAKLSVAPMQTVRLKRVTQGLPSPTSVRVKTYTPPGLVEAARIVVRDPDGMIDYGPSLPSSPDADGYADVVHDGLPEDRELEYRVQLRRSADSEWIRIGGWRRAVTAPVPGTPIRSFRWLAWACAHHEQVEADRAPFVRALRRRPKFGLLCGDQNYADVRARDVAMHRDAWEDAWAHSTGMRDLMANVPHGVEVSDHDSGEGQNRAAGSVAITFQMTAFYQMLPQDQVLKKTRAFAFTWGRFDFICPDFRTRYRDDPTSLPADDPTKTSYGAPQMEWISERIAAAKAAGHFIFFVSDAVWLGEYAMQGKPDCHAHYMTCRQDIADQLLGYPHMIVDFDFHCLRCNWTGEGNPSGGPVVGAAGMIANTGNYRGDGFYTWMHNPEHTAVREFVDFDCTDNGTSWTVTAHFFDVLVDSRSPIHHAQWTWAAPTQRQE